MSLYPDPTELGDEDVETTRMRPAPADNAGASVDRNATADSFVEANSQSASVSEQTILRDAGAAGGAASAQAHDTGSVFPQTPASPLDLPPLTFAPIPTEASPSPATPDYGTPPPAAGGHPGNAQPQPGYGQQGYAQPQPGYAQPYPGYGQPYGAAPGYGAPGGAYAPVGVPVKSRLAAGLLGIFLGALGIHRFYLGYTGIGLTMLLLSVLSFGFLSGFVAIWGLVEGILYLASKQGSYAVDSEGRPLAS